MKSFRANAVEIYSTDSKQNEPTSTKAIVADDESNDELDDLESNDELDDLEPNDYIDDVLEPNDYIDDMPVPNDIDSINYHEYISDLNADKDPSEEPRRKYYPDELESLIIDANAFWYKIHRIQDTITLSSTYVINQLLPVLYSNLQLIISNRNLPIYMSRLAIYIAPNGEKNIPLMKMLYARRVSLENIDIYCYRPYNTNQQIIETLTMQSVTAIYTDLWFQGSIGYKHGKPVVNMLIVVKKVLADKILKKELIMFKPDQPSDQPSNQSQSSSRHIYMQTIPIIDAYIDNIIGEYNLLNYIGYIEILPSDDKLIDTNSTFTELADVRDMLKLVSKAYNTLACTYCTYNQLQCNMLKCSKCKLIYYCSSICQMANWPTHKITCK